MGLPFCYFHTTVLRRHGKQFSSSLLLLAIQRLVHQSKLGSRSRCMTLQAHTFVGFKTKYIPGEACLSFQCNPNSICRLYNWSIVSFFQWTTTVKFRSNHVFTFPPGSVVLRHWHFLRRRISTLRQKGITVASVRVAQAISLYKLNKHVPRSLLTFDCTSAATFIASTCFAASRCFICHTIEMAIGSTDIPDLGNDMSDITRWFSYGPESQIRNFPPFVLLALLQQRHRAKHRCLPHRPHIEASPAVTCVATCLLWLFGPWRFSNAPLVWTTRRHAAMLFYLHSVLHGICTTNSTR